MDQVPAVLPLSHGDELAIAQAKSSQSQERYGAPRCRCSSRNTTRVGDSALLRQCNACGNTYAYRLNGLGLLVPLDILIARMLDEERELAGVSFAAFHGEGGQS